MERIETLAEKVAKWTGSVWSIIMHTAMFIGAFTISFFGVALNSILLIVTTIVSLEAIYLSIFIQMTSNKHDKSIKEIHKRMDAQ